MQLGSIVSFKRSRWVVMGTSPSGHGHPDVRIARPCHGRLESLTVGPEGLKLIEVPRFQPGERLKLGARGSCSGRQWRRYGQAA